ncbi:MAG: response regulator [Gemmatimonadota bacterium]
MPAEVLLVEDDPADAEPMFNALREVLESARIARARDGAEALDSLAARGTDAYRASHPTPRLILLDLKLPRIDGIEVLKHIKTNAATMSIPVVVLTSSSQDADLVRSYQLGANGYVRKPMTIEGFRALVQELGRFWLQMIHPVRNPDARA